MDMGRAPALIAASGLALAALLGAGAAAKDAGPHSGYIVPAAAGSAEDPALRPPLPPGLTFLDGTGMPIPLAHFRGQVLLMNFWATWCAPCIKEMAFLNRLQGDLKGEPLRVLAISEDRGGIPVAKTFLDKQKLPFLHPYADPTMALAEALNVQGLPTSLIVDKQGRLVQRVEGPYEWDNPPIVARFRQLLAEAPPP